MTSVDEDCHPLVKRLVEAMNVERKSLTEVSTKAGFDRNTIRGWVNAKAVPRFDHLEAALNVMGLELFIRPKRNQGETTNVTS
jgi:DNA-binding phage protein